MNASDIYTFGLSRKLVEAAKWSRLLKKWRIIYKPVFESYKTKRINQDCPDPSPEEEVMAWAEHVKEEREYWAQTKDCWHLWSNDELLFEAVKIGVEQYLQLSPVEVEQQHVDAKPKFKGRKTCFRDNMLDDADGRKLQILHNLIDGKDSNNARLIIDAAVSVGWLTKPSGSSVANEFKGISKSTYNNADATYKYKDCDLKVISKKLEDMLNLPPEA